MVVIPVASTTPNRSNRSRPPSRHTELAEETADSVLTQHSSPESWASPSIHPETQSSPPVIPESQSHISLVIANLPSSPEVSPPLERNPFPALLDDLDLDTMPYHPYVRYTDGPDAEAHICSFLNTWQANHSTQRLIAGEIDASKIAEFILSLDGPTARWYSRHDTGSSPLSRTSTQFLELFCREIPIRELLSQFYTIEQGPHETVAQFVLRFQDLYRQVARDVSANHLKDTLSWRFSATVWNRVRRINQGCATLHMHLANKPSLVALEFIQRGASKDWTLHL